MTAKDVVVREGDWISVDGGSGQVFIGKIPMTEPSLEEQVELMTLLKWADEICGAAGSCERRPRGGRRAACRCGQMPTIPRMPAGRARTAPWGSGCAARSTCSSSQSACRSYSE